MNTLEIATRVKAQFGDTDGAQIVDADIIRWINDAMREIIIDVELMQRRATINLTTAADYQLSAVSAQMLKIIAVKIRNSSGNDSLLTPISLREALDKFDGIDNTTPPVGVPTHYSIWNATISLYPSPQSAVTNGLVIYYVARPTEIAAIDTTIPELPVEFHNRIVEYCIAQAAELDDNLPLADRKMAQFENGVTKLRNSTEQQPDDFYPTITYTGNDYYV